jgi:hypothetical protein
VTEAFRTEGSAEQSDPPGSSRTDTGVPSNEASQDEPPSEEGRGGKAVSPFAELTPQDVLELFQTGPGQPPEARRPETAASLPEWLDIPLLPGRESTPAPSTKSAIPSQPPASTVELPPLPSQLPPISISPTPPSSHPTPILDAKRIRRLQELAERGPWSRGTLSPGAREREVSQLPHELPSILLTECRPGTTTAALIEGVEGRPRLIASRRASTDGNPIAAIQRACEAIADHTGQRLFDENGTVPIPQQATGRGVDHFVAVVDAAPPSPGLFTPADDYHHRALLRELRGTDQLRAWSDASLRSVPYCLAMMIRYLGETYEANVIGLDLGMAESWLVVWYGEQLTVIAGGGLEASMQDWSYSEDRAPIKALMTSLWRDWTTRDWTTRDRTTKEKSIDLLQPPVLDLILVRGSALTMGPTPLGIARLVADVLQPGGTCTLLWDRDGLIAPLGALATRDPAVAACLLDGDALLRLGTLIAPWGHPPSKGVALRFALTGPGGQRQQGDVAAGCLRQIHLPLGCSAMLALHPASGLDLGTGQPGRGARVEVPGGLVGLLLDGRGRPLPVQD